MHPIFRVERLCPEPEVSPGVAQIGIVLYDTLESNPAAVVVVGYQGGIVQVGKAGPVAKGAEQHGQGTSTSQPHGAVFAPEQDRCQGDEAEENQR